jgi:hypothetical protein
MEYKTINSEASNRYPIDNSEKREGFVEGAIYVLSRFENLSDNVKLFSDLSSKSMLYDKMNDLIEELKK